MSGFERAPAPATKKMRRGASSAIARSAAVATAPREEEDSACRMTDHSITSSARFEDGRWDGQPERLCGLQIDDQLKFGRLLDWQVGRVGALQDLIDVIGR